MDMAVQEPVLKRHQARSCSSAAGATPWFQLRWHRRLHERQLLPVLLLLVTVMFVRLTFFFCCCCCGGGDGGGGWSHRCFLQRLLAEAVPSSIRQLRPSPSLSLPLSICLALSLQELADTRVQDSAGICRRHLRAVRREEFFPHLLQMGMDVGSSFRVRI